MVRPKKTRALSNEDEDDDEGTLCVVLFVYLEGVEAARLLVEAGAHLGDLEHAALAPTPNVHSIDSRFLRFWKSYLGLESFRSPIWKRVF